MEFADARYHEIDSPHGHDAFLIELEQVGSAIRSFLVELGVPTA
jgi:homoserine acetyltransferase